MVAIQVRGVSESVRDSLARDAKAQGVSMQAYLHDVLERQARAANNRAILRSFNTRSPRSSVDGGVVALIEQGRRERDEQITEALSLNKRS